jgi:DNA primase (bacterial type)
LHSIAKFQLRLFVDPILDEVGVIFPILNKDASKVLDMWVRMIDQKKFFRLSREFLGSLVDYHAPNLWFGNHLMSTERPVVLVEDALDALRLDSLGVQNCLASLGEPSREQIAGLYAPAVYLGFDGGGDRAGGRYTKKVMETLQVPAVSLLDWGVVGVKDAGALESEAQLRAVFDARIKILKSQKTKTERRVKEEDPATSILRGKKDDTFL